MELLAAKLERVQAANAAMQAGQIEWAPPELDDVEIARQLRLLRESRWLEIPPGRFRCASLDTIEGQPEGTVEKLAEWAADPAGRNLVLFGAVGVGKTFAALAACRVPFEAGEVSDVRFLPVVELLDLLRPGGVEGAYNDLVNVDLLILDDLGTERPTEWSSERLYALVNRRWMEERPIVVTTNLEANELVEAVGGRMASRLMGSGSVTTRMGGDDRRHG
jgi:DNA replication protein DnaC